MEDSNNFPPVLLEVKTARGKKFIRTADIAYIKSSNKHSFLFFSSAEPSLECHSLLKWFAEKLPVPQYCRCHDSYIVNFQCYDCIHGNSIILKSNAFIPVSPKRKAICVDMLKLFLIRK